MTEISGPGGEEDVGDDLVEKEKRKNLKRKGQNQNQNIPVKRKIQSQSQNIPVKRKSQSQNILGRTPEKEVRKIEETCGVVKVRQNRGEIYGVIYGVQEEIYGVQGEIYGVQVKQPPKPVLFAKN